MKNLILSIEDSTAARFDNLSLREREKIEKTMASLLTEIIKKEQNKILFERMDLLANESEKNGLTVAKLAELMEWDNETVCNIFGDEALKNG